MSRGDRVMMLLHAMSAEERNETFVEISDVFCVTCGVELPDEESKEPDHVCPNDSDDGEDDEDEEDGEDDEDEDDEEEEDDEIDTTSEP